MENGERKSSRISLFNFPRELSSRKLWCNLIKQQDGLDRFHIMKNTKICEKHFDVSVIYRPPGGTRKRLLDGAKPSLHSWNNFGVNVNKRKTPTTRPSPIKKCRVAPE